MIEEGGGGTWSMFWHVVFLEFVPCCDEMTMMICDTQRPNCYNLLKKEVSRADDHIGDLNACNK
jgi:hypothetical protein